jgi:hypothetical protein
MNISAAFFSIAFATFVMVLIQVARAEEGSLQGAEWGGFLDAYYAYDTNTPPNHDRSFTTQPARHNEFNVNLVYLEGKLALERVRGRLAVQAGTSVQSNYSSEPSLGSVSGPSLVRNIQEATAGYRIADGLWLDAGIFFSHIGLESFISRDNWTYTRSLVADYSPYYQSGVKVSYQIGSEWSVQLHVLNGWQNISESNMAKSLGSQLSFTPSATLSVTYNTLIGKEAELRHFHDLVLKWSVTNHIQLGTQADIGFQKLAASNSYATWYGASLVGRYVLTERVALAIRLERYWDKNQIIVTSVSPNGFRSWGASLGADVQLHPRVVWRNEVRGFWSGDPVYPLGADLQTSDGFVVSSLALTI